MGIFPDISPILLRSKFKIRAQIKKVMRFMPERYYEEYRRYLSLLKRQEGRIDSTINWILLNYFLHGGFLQLIIYRNERLVFKAGVEILAWDGSGERELGPELTFDQENGLLRIYFNIREGDRLLEIEGVIPLALKPMVQNIVEAELLPAARNYFFYIPGSREDRIVDLLSGMETHFYQLLNAELGMGRPVTITHIQFQDLRLYFELSGEYLTQSFADSISQTIHQHLKRTDHLIQLSPVSYLVISPGARKEQIQQRFDAVYFQTSRLILDYDFDVVCVENFPVELNKIWQELGL